MGFLKFFEILQNGAKFYQMRPAHIQGIGGTIYGCDTRTAVFAENARKENAIMSTKNTNKLNVPQARAAMDKFKMEAASEVGVNLKEGYNGDLTSREAGYVGGYMVKRLIEQAEHQMAGQSW